MRVECGLRSKMRFSRLLLQYYKTRTEEKWEERLVGGRCAMIELPKPLEDRSSVNNNIFLAAQCHTLYALNVCHTCNKLRALR